MIQKRTEGQQWQTQSKGKILSANKMENTKSHETEITTTYYIGSLLLANINMDIDIRQHQ
jgi:hypothetical protein